MHLRPDNGRYDSAGPHAQLQRETGFEERHVFTRYLDGRAITRVPTDPAGTGTRLEYSETAQFYPTASSQMIDDLVEKFIDKLLDYALLERRIIRSHFVDQI